MKKYNLFISAILLFLLLTYSSYAGNFTWDGSSSTAWTDSSNWTTAGTPGVPSTNDTVTIVTNTNQPLLAANTTIKKFTMTSGTFDCNSYSLTISATATFNGGTINNGTITCSGTSTLTFAGTIFGAVVNATGNNILFSGSVFNSTLTAVKKGTSSDNGTGGNVFNDVVTITDSSSGNLVLSNNSSSPDTFNAALTVASRSSGSIYLAHQGTNNVFNGKVTMYSSSSGRIYSNYYGTAYYNDSIVVNSTSSGGEYFGMSTGSCTVANNKTISIGSEGFDHTASGGTFGTLYFHNFNQSNATAINLTLTGSRATLKFEPGCVFYGNVTVSAPGIFFDGCRFLGKVSATYTTGSGYTLGSVGGNYFGDSVTVIQGNAANVSMGVTAVDTFATYAYLQNTATGFSINNALFLGDVKFKNALTNNQTEHFWVASTGSVTIKGTATIENANSTTLFGSSGGNTVLDTNSTLSITSGSGKVQLWNVVKYGTNSTSISMSGSGDLLYLNTGNVFNGPFYFSGQRIFLNGSTFNGTVNILRTSATTDACDGGNVFNGTTTVICDSVSTSNSNRSFQLATVNPDDFNGNVTFKQYGSGTGGSTVRLYPAYTKNSTFAGNVTVDGTTAIEFGANGGKVIFDGIGTQTLSKSGSYVPSFKRIQVNKSAGIVSLSYPLTLADTLFLTKGVIATDTTNLLTVSDNGIVSGGSDSSYIHGPLKKIGNDAFTFALGDTALHSGSYHPLAISAPSSSTDAFTSRYYRNQQMLGNICDSTMENLSTCEYWKLDRSSGSSNVSVNLGWNNSSCNVFQLSKMKVASWNGSRWKDRGNGGTSGNTSKGTVVSSASISTFSYFTLADSICSSLNVSAVGLPSSAIGLNDGSASVTSRYGSAPYTYLWTPGSLTTSSISGLPTGSYSVMVTDSNGCTAADTITIFEMHAPQLASLVHFAVLSGDSIYSNNLIRLFGKGGANNNISSTITGSDSILKYNSGSVSTALYSLQSAIDTITTHPGNLLSNNLTGLVLPRGYYKVSGNATLNGELKLIGDTTDIYIFDISGDFEIDSSSFINLGNVRQKNIYWNVGLNLDLDNNINLSGTIFVSGHVESHFPISGHLAILAKEYVSFVDYSQGSQLCYSYDYLSSLPSPLTVCTTPNCNLIFNNGFEAGSVPIDQGGLSDLYVDCWRDEPYPPLCGPHTIGSTVDLFDVNFIPLVNCTWTGCSSTLGTCLGIPTNFTSDNIPVNSTGERYVGIDDGEQMSGELTGPLSSTGIYYFSFYARASKCYYDDYPNDSWNCCIGLLEGANNNNNLNLTWTNIGDSPRNSWQRYSICLDISAFFGYTQAQLNPLDRFYFTMNMQVPPSIGRLLVDDFVLTPLADAGPDQTYCTGSPCLDIGPCPNNPNTDPFLSYSWTANPTDPNLCATCINPCVHPSVTTVYTLTVVTSDGCYATDEITITIANAPTVVASADQSICIGASANLTVTGATSYTWNPGNLTGSSVNVSPTTTTVYTVTGTNGNGCQNTDVVTVSVESVYPDPPEIIGPTALCSPYLTDTYTITNFISQTYTIDVYQIISGIPTHVDAITTSSSTFTYTWPFYLDDGYFVITTAGVCQSSDTFYVYHCCDSDPLVTNAWNNTSASIVAPTGYVDLSALPINGDILKINGIFVVDQNLKIYSPSLDYIYMGSGSKIVVLPGFTFQIVNCQLKAIPSCAPITMWSGIEIYKKSYFFMTSSIIHDAENAIKAFDASTYIISDSRFDKNYNCIKIPLSAPNNYSTVISQIAATTFSGLTPLLDRYINQQEWDLNPNAGVVAYNTVNLFINNFIQPDPNILFDHLNYGVIAINSNTNIGHSKFMAIKKTNLINYTGIPATGIGVYGSSTSSFVDVKGALVGNTFFDCNFGVYLNSSSGSVQDCAMFDVGKGVVISNNLVNSNVLVKNNPIFAKTVAIDCFNNTFSDIKIYQSQITMTGTSPIAGIRITETGFFNNYTIDQGNSIHTGFARFGVQLYNVRTSRVRNNSIFLGSTNEMGIYAFGGAGLLGNNIECNFVQSTTAGTGFGFTGTHGILVVQSTHNYIAGNSFNYTALGAGFAGSDLNTTLRANSFNNHKWGLNLYGNTGVRIDNQGNLSRCNGNWWIADPYSPGIGLRAVSVNPFFNQFYYPLTNCNSTAHFYHTNEFPILGVFQQMNVAGCAPAQLVDYASLNCGSSPSPSPLSYLDSTALNTGDTLTAQDSLSFPSEFNSQMTWASKKFLYEKLNRDTFLLVDSLFIKFYNTVKNTAIGDFHAVEDSIKQLQQTGIENQPAFLANDSIIRLMLDTVSFNDSLISISSDSAFIDSVIAINLLIDSTVAILNLENDSMVFAAASARLGKIEALEEFNQGIDADSSYEQNLRTVSAIYLATVAKGIRTFDSTQQSQLESIAAICPMVGGDAVPFARSLYYLVNDTIFYSDFCLVDTTDTCTALPAPGSISGLTMGQCGQTGVSYSVSPVTGATSYSWYVDDTSQTIVNSPNNLSGVSVDFADSLQTVTIYVTANDVCGSSAPSSITVNGIPSSPDTIEGNSAVCSGDVEYYTTTGSSGATAYNWTIPNDATMLSGNGDASMYVLWGISSGELSVTASNDCGESSAYSLDVVVNSCRKSASYITEAGLMAFPNPTKGIVTIRFYSKVESSYTLSLKDITSRQLFTTTGKSAKGVNNNDLNLEGMSKGIYFLNVQSESMNETIRITLE